ncbi:nucleotidyltransferase family protein [Metabacillus malikii]|uniref:Nucleotidyltransferase n=1 Tax=Metabacillus malikii TaxID=1504265 RepID=A0ABT9ZN36_9BACI|nr:hypothetical protein [Metabacillus malikii]MDQ0233227.1 putative nucleotidyltransferase [Metabacillus malikii]
MSKIFKWVLVDCVSDMKDPLIKHLEKQIKASKKFLQEYGIKKIGIFYSYARNQQQNTSDVGILIESEKAIGLEFLSIKYY